MFILIINTQKKTKEREKREREREMRSMKGEVVLNMEAERAWEMYRDNNIISNIQPDMLSHAEYIHGDGSPGSLRLFKLGPAVADYVRESREKIESVEKGRSVRYEVVGGELYRMYRPYRVTFTFTPLETQPGKCVAEWKAEYEPLTPATLPPELAKQAALKFLQCFDKFDHHTLCVPNY